MKLFWICRSTSTRDALATVTDFDTNDEAILEPIVMVVKDGGSVLFNDSGMSE